MNSKTCYRVLRNYKYQLREDFRYKTDITGYEVDLSFVKLDIEGNLTIFKNYAWDGASDPTRDTLNSMRPSLVHDAFYQLMRMGKLPQYKVVPVDKLFRRMCKHDGMSPFRAWYWYVFLRLANGKAARLGTEEPDTLVYAPE